jgi:hypothetical protein
MECKRNSGGIFGGPLQRSRFHTCAPMRHRFTALDLTKDYRACLASFLIDKLAQLGDGQALQRISPCQERRIFMRRRMLWILTQSFDLAARPRRACPVCTGNKQKNISIAQVPLHTLSGAAEKRTLICSFQVRRLLFESFMSTNMSWGWRRLKTTLAYTGFSGLSIRSNGRTCHAQVGFGS